MQGFRCPIHSFFFRHSLLANPKRRAMLTSRVSSRKPTRGVGRPKWTGSFTRSRNSPKTETSEMFLRLIMTIWDWLSVCSCVMYLRRKGGETTWCVYPKSKRVVWTTKFDTLFVVSWKWRVVDSLTQRCVAFRNFIAGQNRCKCSCWFWAKGWGTYERMHWFPWFQIFLNIPNFKGFAKFIGNWLVLSFDEGSALVTNFVSL